MRPDELPDVVVVHPLSAPDEPVTYVSEDDETVEAFELVLEIVRCRDCKHSTGTPEQFVCKLPCGDYTASSAWCEPDGFCKWGEAR